MNMDFEKIYRDGAYAAKNPDWSAADAPWKAGMIAALLKKNKIDFHEMIEVGCGSGKILSSLQETFPGKNYKGYDISPQAIALAQKIVNPQLVFKEADFIIDFDGITDVLLVIDVVEHVADYYGFLNRLHSKSNNFVFHIPLDLSCRTIFKPHVNLQQRQSVGHIHYFTKDAVLWMLEDCGYRVVDWHYTKPRIDLDKVKGMKANIKKALRNYSYRIAPEWSVKLWGGYSMMILAK
jgi:cyclopropane fatty-acyl-phospholipid synthase-like methyltransferase